MLDSPADLWGYKKAGSLSHDCAATNSTTIALYFFIYPSHVKILDSFAKQFENKGVNNRGLIQTLKAKAERMIRKLRVRECPNPFVIWFQGRSGSSHLCSLLDSHPEVSCLYEDFHAVRFDSDASLLFNWRNVNQLMEEGKVGRRITNFDKSYLDSPTTQQVLAHFYDTYSFNKQACGFKWKFPIQFPMFPEIWGEIQRMQPRLKIIALTRRNPVKQAVSYQSMDRLSKLSKNGHRHFHDKFDPELKARVKTEPLKVIVPLVIRQARYLRDEKVDFEKLVSAFEGKHRISVLRLEYEDLLTDEKTCMSRVLNHIGVSPNLAVQSHYEKATPNQLSDALENYDDLLDAIVGTDLEMFLTKSDQ